MLWLKRLARWSFFLAIGLFALVLIAIIGLRWINPPVTAFMVQQSAADRAYEWIDFEDISDSAALAVVAAEDQRFANHAGLDLQAIEKALEEAERGDKKRGASTITQQLAKNLFLWPGRNLARKSIEAGLSVLIDALLPKRRILELYLNVVEFGPGVYGVDAASWAFFAKPPAQLSDSEAALLAAVLPNPKRLRVATPSDYVRQRQSWILSQIRRLRAEGTIDSIVGHSTHGAYVPGIASRDSECDFIPGLIYYAQRDPIEDAKLHFASGSTRFLLPIAYDGNEIIAGIDSGAEGVCVREKYSLQSVAVAESDVQCDTDDLVGEFFDYATRYNQQMKSLLLKTGEYAC